MAEECLDLLIAILNHCSDRAIARLAERLSKQIWVEVKRNLVSIRSHPEAQGVREMFD
jgi:hypothetical protein